MSNRASSDILSAGARAALTRARETPLSYGVRLYLAPGYEPRVLVVLGEAHLKLAAASATGKEVMRQFELRGVETFQKKRVALGRVLGVFIHVPRLALRTLSFGLVKDSTITDAKAMPTGHTVELEDGPTIPLALHAASIYLTAFFALATVQIALALLSSFLPGETHIEAALPWLTLAALALEMHLVALVPAYILRRHTWSWLIHPAIGLVASRDTLMAEGTVRMLRDHPEARSAVVVMGRAHLPGFERELVEKHGFVRIDD